MNIPMIDHINFQSSQAQKQERSSNFTYHKNFSQKQNRNLKKIFAKPEILQDCLLTLDIFKNIIEDAGEMKNRVIRDVFKSLTITSYQKDDVIYDVQDQSNQLFLVFQGTISLNIKKVKPVEGEDKKEIISQVGQLQQPQKQLEYIYEQIDTYQKGQGFGQAQFIRARKRDFQAQVKQNQSIIGKLHIQSFEEVVENYKMRIYFKKIDMFRQCPLLSEMSNSRLQFIVNNSKPILLGMSKVLIHEGEYPKCLYLVSKGQLQIFKNNQITKFNFNNNFSAFKSKKMSKYYSNSYQSKEKIQIRKITQGAFLGDVEIAFNETFKYDVRTASQKVYLYTCDIRMILNQITEEELQKSKIFYENKILYQKNQVTQIKKTRKIIYENSQFTNVMLTPDQIKIKKQIRKRYLDTNKPFSLVDESSPLQISKMLQRKQTRLKTFEYTSPIQQRLPSIEFFTPKRQKKRKPKFQVKSIELSMPKLRTTSTLSQSLLNCIKLNSERHRQNQNVYLTQPEEQRKIKVKDLILDKKKMNLPPIILMNQKVKFKIEEDRKRVNKTKIKNKKSQIVKTQPSEIDPIQVNRRLTEFIERIKIQRMK